MPPADGLKAHVQLARISNFIVCNVYQVSPTHHSSSPDSFVEQSMAMLEQWQRNLPPSLQMANDGPPSTDPGVCMLQMHFNNLVIQTLRPSLVAALRSNNNRRSSHPAPPSSSSASPSVHGGSSIGTQYSEVLTSAAQRNMRLARHVATLHRPRRLLHSGLYFVLTAVVCFQLQSLLGDEQAPTREVDFAIELFDREAQTGNTYGISSVGALRELKALIAIVKSGSSAAAASMTAMELDASLVETASWINDGQEGDANSNTLYDEVLSWMDQDWSTYDTEMQQ